MFHIRWNCLLQLLRGKQAASSEINGVHGVEGATFIKKDIRVRPLFEFSISFSFTKAGDDQPAFGVRPTEGRTITVRTVGSKNKQLSDDSDYGSRASSPLMGHPRKNSIWQRS